MRKGRGRRAVVASMFVIGSATVGVAMSAGSVGAGVTPPDGDGEGIPCEVEEGNGGPGPAPAPAQNGRVESCAQLDVTKVVTGTPAPAPPPGTAFAVVVDCVPTERDGMVPIPRDGIMAQQLPQGQSPPFTTTLTFAEGGGTQRVFIDRPSDCTVSETPPPGCTLTSIDPGTTEIRSPTLHSVRVTNNCDPPQPAVAVAEVPRFTG